MDLGLKEKVVLVTGASKGLGKAIAEEFAREGAHVSICARGKADLEKTAAELRVQGVKVVATSGDVTRNDDVQRVINETIKNLGRIDVLVNNAGDAWIGRNVESSDQDWRDCMEVNLYSAVRFTRGIVPQNATARRRPHHQYVNGKRAYSSAHAGRLQQRQGRSARVHQNDVVRARPGRYPRQQRMPCTGAFAALGTHG